ncbi:MAG: TrkA family potassium uptake protein [Candidatus Omnitrophica bacterium]|nr:TrkA family potassium uptake protein [Candidatus Omnitrophota bacterium]
MRQFAVIGLDRFGASVAKTLSEKGYQVLAIDIEDDKVQDFSEIVTQAVCADATDEKALKAIGVNSVDVAVVSVGGNIEASVLITLVLKEIGIKEVVAKAVTEEQGKVLERIGANRIVFPERDMGIRIANSLISPKVSEHIDLSSACSIIEIKAPKEFIGKSLKQLSVRARYGLNIAAIKSVDESGVETVNSMPEADYKIKAVDKLMVIGSNENIERLKEKE